MFLIFNLTIKICRKMKLRVKNLMDNINDLEKDMSRNMERFKSYIA